MLIGWNVVQFDARSAKHAERYRIPLRLGRGNSELDGREHTALRTASFAQANGRLIIDGIDALKIGVLEFLLLFAGGGGPRAAGRRQSHRQPMGSDG